MAIGQVTKYDKLQSHLIKYPERHWDDPTAGNVMWLLATKDYTPDVTHDTVADLSSDYISAGDGAPINATSLDVDDATTAGVTYLDSALVNFGEAVSITAKYLVAVKPATPGTLAGTSKLLFYVDLNTDSTSAEVSSIASAFKINAPANGWVRI